MKLADKVKEELSLRAYVERRDGVQWHPRKTSEARGDFWACCPLHGESTPSFHVLEPAGRAGLFKCFGCGAGGSIIDYVMARDGVDAGAAIKLLAEDGRIQPDDEETAAARRAERAKRREAEEAKAERAAERRLRMAADIWKGAAARSDLVRRYLLARGVDLAALEARFGEDAGFWRGVPPTLRCAKRAEFWHESAREPAFSAPAMVGFIEAARLRKPGVARFAGVHRTWITAEGRARFANSETKIPKKWLGASGRMFGGFVKLAPAAATCVVGEGIETTLAAFAAEVAAGRRDVTAEAALSLGALVGAGGAFPEHRRGWRPGVGVERVLVYAEGRKPDAEKDAAARAKGRATRAEWAEADLAAIGDRLRAMGLVVELYGPPDGPSSGRDFADDARAAP